MANLRNAIRGRRVLVLVIGVLMIGVAAFSVVFWTGLPFTGETKAANTADSSRPIPAGFTPFRNDQAGFELAYPASWSLLDAGDARALLVASPDKRDGLKVRAFDLGQPVDRQLLGFPKQLADQMVAANKDLQMLAEPKQVELGGVPGFLYVYSYKEPNGQEGLHSHWILFNDKTAITLVFQALPKERFADSAAIINQIITTFRVL